MTVEIREAGEADLAAITDLKREVEDRTYSTYGTSAEHALSLDTFCSVNYVRVLAASSRLLVAVDSALGIVGMVSSSSKYEAIAISALYCRVTGRGIGKLLLIDGLSEGRDADVARCEVFDKNVAARAFFERRGFRATGSSRPSESYAGRKLLELSGPIELVRASV